MQYRIFTIICISVCTMTLTACKKEQKNTNHTKYITAISKAPIERLYYSGKLSPIASKAVIAPVAGNIESMHFTYGQKIKKDQNLLVISSQSLSDKYRTAVSSFLQKKQSYTTGKLSFSGTQALYKAGVISQDQYSSEKTQFDNAILDYFQSRYQLEKVLSTANLSADKVEALSISDTQKVNAILQKHFSHIVIKAPISGVALYPIGNDSDSGKSLSVGQSIKESQLLLLVGQLSGLRAKFQVSEVDIDRILKNMRVKVTSTAFPDLALQGYVSAVSSQAAQSANDAGLSMFNVSVNIPALSKEAAEKIRVGMTAKFEIDIVSKKKIMIPVSAVYQKNGESFVTLLTKSGKTKSVLVKTGATTPTEVVILSGVKSGDRVRLND